MARIYLERRLAGDISRDLQSLSGDLRQFLDVLGGEDAPAPYGPEYRPQLDVIETVDAIEIAADLPGVSPDAVRIVFSRGAVIVAGRKNAPACACDHRDAAFHLAERTFGRFACVVRVGSAVDARRAKATLAAGELHVVLPRVEDRRGRDIAIAIESVP